MVVDVPDLDDMTAWDGSTPLALPPVASTTSKPRPGWPAIDTDDSRGNGGDGAPGSRLAGESTTGGDRGSPGTWPPSGGGGTGTGSGSSFANGNFARRGRSQGIVEGGTNAGQIPGGNTSSDLAMNRNFGQSHRAEGAGGSGSQDASPDDFVWPSNSRTAGPRGTLGAGSARIGPVPGLGAGDPTGFTPGTSGGSNSSSSAAGGTGSGDRQQSGGLLSPADSNQSGSGTGLLGRGTGGNGQPGQDDDSSNALPVGQGLASNGGGSQSTTGARSGSGLRRTRLARTRRGIGTDSKIQWIDDRF